MTQAPATLIQSQARTGIVLMIAAWGTFSVIDTSAKFLVMAAIPAVQVAFMRYAVQFLFTVIEGSRDGISIIRTLDRTTLTLLILRGSILVVSTFFNFVAVKYLSLTMTSAIMFSSPIFVALLSIIFLGERVGIWRWSAIIVGFIGVLIIVRPFNEDFHWAALLSLHNAVAVAVFSMITRRLAGTVNAQVMQFFAGGLGMLALLPFAIYAWRMPTETIGWVLLFVMGGAAWLGHNMFSRAHIYASASTLMPFSYSFIIFMSLSSTIFFATRPDIWVYVGAALVAGSGLIIWWREKQNNPQDT
jgi:drug/metabolite transporter (DMT)-like permease